MGLSSLLNSVVNFNYSYSSGVDTAIEDRFKLEFMPVTRTPLGWKEELKRTADHIADATDRPLYLCLSGGIDSEVMARAFMEAGRKFKAVTVQHSHNKHDIQFADRFCQKYDIEQVHLDLDVTQFSRPYVAQGYRATNLFRYLQLWILEQIEALGGSAVLGGGEQIYYTVGNEIYLKYDPGFILPLKWLKDRGVNHHWPYFHMATPEVMAAYMNIDVIQLLLSQPQYFRDHHVLSIEKILVYHGYWSGMERRSKFNGFEHLLPLRKYIEEDLVVKFPDIQPAWFPIKTIQDQLAGK